MAQQGMAWHGTLGHGMARDSMAQHEPGQRCFLRAGQREAGFVP